MPSKNRRQTAGLYIHIPFCSVKCMYCDFYSIPQREKDIPTFVDILCKEIDLYSDKYPTDLPIDTIFFGGGTPSLLNKSSLDIIIEKIYSRFNLTYLKEFTIESNPGEAPKDRLNDYINLGINRLSIGFQSFDNDILKFLGRAHSSDDCFKTFENAREVGFNNINIDLIFDIPNQSLDLWKKDLEKAVNLNSEHICTYSLTVEQNTTLHKLVKSGNVIMPNEEIDVSMYQHSMNYLKENNFEQYEISNFSKKGFHCLHNLHYWELEPYYAFGPSAHGYNGDKRYWNVKNIDKYFSLVSNGKLPLEGEEKLTDTNRFNELIFNGLRLAQGVPLNQLSYYTNKDIYKLLEAKIQKWNGLKINNNNLFLDGDSILLADEIASDLFLS